MSLRVRKLEADIFELRQLRREIAFCENMLSGASGQLTLAKCSAMIDSMKAEIRADLERFVGRPGGGIRRSESGGEDADSSAKDDGKDDGSTEKDGPPTEPLVPSDEADGGLREQSVLGRDRTLNHEVKRTLGRGLGETRAKKPGLWEEVEGLGRRLRELEFQR